MTAGVRSISLGEVVSPSRPRVKPTNFPNLPFIGMEHIEAHSMKLLGTAAATEMKSSAVHFKPGDVLYGRLRPYLNKVYRPNFEGLCSAEFIVLPENDRIDGAFLQYFLNSAAFVRFASHINAGDRPRVGFDEIAAYEIPLPAKSAQRKIVAEIEKQFSRLDEAVANLKRVKANLKRYKAAVLKAAMEGRLVPTEAMLASQEGRSFETGEQLLERTRSIRFGKRLTARNAGSDNKDVWANLYALPCGWATATIGDMFDVYVGATPSRAERSYWNGEIPWVSSGEVSFCRIRCTREQISEAGLANSSVRLHPKGTVLLGMIGEGKTRGQAAILDIEAGNNQNAAAIRVSETEVVPEFVYYFFEKEYEATRRRGSGGNQPALNKARVQSVLFPIPPVAEQKRIATEIEYRFSLIRGVDEQVNVNLQRSERMRQSILAVAFSHPNKRNHEEIAA